jgi:hypothetical protein
MKDERASVAYSHNFAHVVNVSRLHLGAVVDQRKILV